MGLPLTLGQGLVLKKDLKEGSLSIEERIWSKYFEKYWKLKTARIMITTQELQTLLDMWMEKLQPLDEKGYNKRTCRKMKIFDISHQVFT